MAAGSSEEMVPQLFEDDSSDDSEYCSIADDASGAVNDNLVPSFKEVVLNKISSLDYNDEVSLMFLLADDLSDTLQKFLEPVKCGKVLEDWLTLQQDGQWENKFIEALYIIGNIQALSQLVEDVSTEKLKFAPQSAGYSMFVHRIKKALYLLCEGMYADELFEMVQRVKEKEPTKVKKTFRVEYMELNFMYWASCNVFSLQDADMTVLKSVLKSMDRIDLLTILESAVQAPSVDRDGPANESSSNKRMCVNPAISSSLARITLSTGVYPIDPSNVGICLIINQKYFHKEAKARFRAHLIPNEGKRLNMREGTEVDRDRLSEVFRSMGFTVIVQENLKHLEILNSLKNIVNTQVKKEHSCFALAILSHGAEGIVSGSNSVAVYKTELDEILTEAENLRCKPKLMIIQACQGEELQRVVFSDDISLDSPTSTNKKKISVPKLSDILTFWSTVPGYAAVRNNMTGSWFIEALWHVLMAPRTNEDLGSLFTRVSNAVSMLVHEGVYGMQPVIVSSTRKSIVLPHHPRYTLEVAVHLYNRYLLDALAKEYIRRRPDLYEEDS